MFAKMLTSRLMGAEGVEWMARGTRKQEKERVRALM